MLLRLQAAIDRDEKVDVLLSGRVPIFDFSVWDLLVPVVNGTVCTLLLYDYYGRDGHCYVQAQYTI